MHASLTQHVGPPWPNMLRLRKIIVYEYVYIYIYIILRKKYSSLGCPGFSGLMPDHPTRHFSGGSKERLKCLEPSNFEIPYAWNCWINCVCFLNSVLLSHHPHDPAAAARQGLDMVSSNLGFPGWLRAQGLRKKLPNPTHKIWFEIWMDFVLIEMLPFLQVPIWCPSCRQVFCFRGAFSNCTALRNLW